MGLAQSNSFTLIGAFWARDPAMATLLARQAHEGIDELLLSPDVRASWSIHQLLARGIMSALPDPRLAPWVPLSTEYCYQTLLAIAGSRGDPPAPPIVARNARAILEDSLSPDVQLQLLSLWPSFVLWQQQLQPGPLWTGGDSDSLMKTLRRVFAALALPHDQLPTFLPGAQGSFSQETVGYWVQRARQVATSDPSSAERLLLHALKLAARSDNPEDDLQVLNELASLQMGHEPREETLLACAERAALLVERGQGNEKLGIILAALIKPLGQLDSAHRMEQLTRSLAETADALLRRLDPGSRLELSIATAHAWLRLGRLDRVDLVLWRLHQGRLAPSELLRVASLEATILSDSNDKQDATDVLSRALEQARDANPDARMRAINNLLDCWPEKREGMERWVDELLRLFARKPPGGDPTLDSLECLQFADSLLRMGQKEAARALAKRIDWGLLDFQSPEVQPFVPALQWTKARLESNEDASPPIDSTLDARTMEDRAGMQLQQGLRFMAFESLGAAGKLYHLENKYEKSLSAFERAFRLFEQDMTYLPRASLVVRRLAVWPEFYTRAALSALKLGRPLEAVALAETGRCRAIGGRLGPAARSCPDPVEPELWERYIRTWRMAVAQVANDLIDEDARISRSTDSRLEGELDELRRQLLEVGVPPERLAPVDPPVPVEEVIQRLRHSSRPTVILYAIRLSTRHGREGQDDTLRFIRLSPEGARELALGEQDQLTLLEACDTYVAALRKRAAGSGPHPTDEALMTALLSRVSEPLGRILEQALDGQEGGRLLWIPQGSLVVIPIQACRVGEGFLVDRAAVLIAPSLTLGMMAIEPDRVQLSSRGVVVRGRVNAASMEAPTDGGPEILSGLLGPSAPESIPGTVGEFNALVRGSSVVHLVCHGVYAWNDPLASFLKLGFDLEARALFDEVRFEPGSLALFGTCDSATVAQDTLNEAIGIPIGLLSAGAHSVVGARWMVAKIASLGICLRFLRALARGESSPEALQQAGSELRRMTLQQLANELMELRHPYAPKVAALAASRPDEAYFEDKPFLWASYAHWGGGWRTRRTT